MADFRHDGSAQLIQRAVDLAADAHRLQFRKGGDGVPYLVHPLRVGELLAKAGCPERVVVAGILHDVLEDTVVDAAVLQAAFGADVLALVEGASEPDKQASWEERKQHTLDALETAPLEICLVVAADKLDNLSGLAADKALHLDAVWERFNRGAEAQRWYYTSLTALLEARGGEDPRLARLAAQLSAVCAQIFDS